MSKRVGISMACLAAALAAACHKEPEGQVAAKVNGDEVTLQELNTELQNANFPANVDKNVAQRQVLQQVINRKLIIAAAKDRGIDKSPDFLSQKRRADEVLLAQTYARQQLAAVPLPSDAEVTKFMADHPSFFGNRELLQLDQIRLAPPRDPQQLRALDADHSMDAVAQHLTAMGIKFDRMPSGLDTAQASPELLQAISKLPPNEPFVIPSGGLLTVNVVTGRKPIPTDIGQQKAAAVQVWRQQKFGEMMNQQVATLKSSAKIEYQNGFSAPPAAPAKPGAAAPAPKAG